MRIPQIEQKKNSLIFPFAWALSHCRSRLAEARRSHAGFTIIETLAAIAILLLSLTAPLTIAEKGLAAAEAARHEITAFYLAQEAIEYVRNIRDANAIAKEGNGPNWLQGLQECLRSEGCGIDATAAIGQQIVGCKRENDDCTLYQYAGSMHELEGLFGHRIESDWAKTAITRKVFVEEIQNDIEAKITVTVTWRAGSLGTRALTLHENIFSWYVSD
jgi:hypothetical protein